MAEAEFEDITYEKRDGKAYVTINRPDRLNALRYQTNVELGRAWLHFRDDPDCRVAILSGAGDRAFSAGWDLKAAAAGEEEAPSLGRPRVAFGGLSGRLKIWKPIIAAVNGLAYGGGFELTMYCDIRIASENAVFSMAETRIGSAPSSAATQRFVQFVPQAIANYVILTGQPIDAKEAYRIGLISHLAPAGEVMKVADTIADQLLETAPLAVMAAKQAIEVGRSLAFDQAELFDERQEFMLEHTEDCDEGIRAFVEKRKPVWKGR